MIDQLSRTEGGTVSRPGRHTIDSRIGSPLARPFITYFGRKWTKTLPKL